MVGSPQHAEKSASASFRIVNRDTSNAAAGKAFSAMTHYMLIKELSSQGYNIKINQSKQSACRTLQYSIWCMFIWSSVI